MGFNFVTNIESCYVDIPKLLYYSHIPTAIIAILIGFFVLIKSKNLSGVFLFLLSLFFSLWSIFDLVTWVAHDSRIIAFSFIIIYLLESLVFITSFYFVVSFVKRGNIELIHKGLLVFLLPVIILLPSSFSAKYFEISSCEAILGNLTYYLYFFDTFLSLCIISFLIKNYFSVDREFKKQIRYLFIGVILFLISFSWTNIFGGLTTNWDYAQYGLFGMTIFMAFLAYLIVKFKAFNIKMLATSALVITQLILVASLLFYATSPANQILILINLAVTLGLGYMLAKSVKIEVERKEQLQDMSNKLAVANDQLRKLDNAKSEFISIASHQLRTPLTAVKGFLSLMLEGSYGKIPEKQRDILGKVNISNERLITLVEDLLNLSRIESGRMEFEFKLVDMKKVCQEVYDTFMIRAKERNLYFDMKLPEHDLPEVETDRNKIREIISNLVDNALKYTPKGGVSVKLTGDNEMVRISVTDTGIGVPKEEIPYLFAKFSRGKDISRLNTGGTGLGLHVGQRMIDELKGKILVDSKGAGQGSTFSVELPVKHVGEK